MVSISSCKAVRVEILTLILLRKDAMSGPLVQNLILIARGVELVMVALKPNRCLEAM
jgi:hypothetical protein